MSTSHEIKEGDVYACEVCGLTLKVTKRGKRYGTPIQECDENDSACEACGAQSQFFVACCGTHLKKVSAAQTVNTTT
ncbi:MAG: hypothetical protein JW937_04795 [Candidatus Omnitrophica bacterium]|nr:hypothetical protein [Candidatus Omnitrophota bacterium]